MFLRELIDSYKGMPFIADKGLKTLHYKQHSKQIHILIVKEQVF
jgi:hypothetical protein